MLSNTAALLSFLRLRSLPWASHQEVIDREKQSPFNQHFGLLVNETLHSWNVPGISIAVVDGDEIFAEV